MQRIKSQLTRGRALFLLAVVGLLALSSMGALYSLEIRPVGLEGVTAQMTDDEINDLKEKVDQQKDEWGYVSQFGRTGRIVSINENEVTVNTPTGELSFSVNANTKIHQYNGKDSDALRVDNLQVGLLVIVDGATGTPSKGAAQDIEVLKEGPAGFNIAPLNGEDDSDNPRRVPIFP